MKRLLIILFIIISIKSYGQLPNQVGQGSELTEWWQKGITGADLGIRWRLSFGDTTAANNYKSGLLKNISGFVIRVVDDYWSRSNDLTKWNKINGGVGGGSPNTSVGVGYPIAITGTNNVKKIRDSTGISIDSAVTNTIRITNTLPAKTTVLDSISDIATFAGDITSNLIIKDTLRGGPFYIYDGTDTADNYMVCEDALGRKWQRFVQDGVLNARWFKFKALDVALTNAQNDMAPYMRAMLDYVNTHQRFTEIYIPEDRSHFGSYFFLTRVTLDAKVKIRGDGTINYPTTKLLSWVNTGLFFQPYLKADGDVVTTELVNLNLSASTSTDSSIALFETRSPTHWENVRIEGTGGNGGNGLTILATSTVGDSLGNADRSSFKDCSFNQSYNGTYIYGDDANKIIFTNCEWVGNKRWGLWDNGFLGNTVNSPHFAYNGANGTTSKSVVSYGGLYYVALIDTGHSNINRQPDISPTYWSEVSGMAATAWDPGFIYMSGGAYAVTDLNAWSKCYDIYSECAQPPSKLNTRSEMTAGDNCAGVITSTGGVYKYILTSTETQTGSMEFPTTDAHLSIGAARPVANTSALYMEISNGNPISIHANALGPFCSIKFNQSSDAGVAALIAYSGGARYLQFYPGNTLVMQLQETLGMVPGTHNTFDIGTSGNTWKDIWGQTYHGSGASLTGVIKPSDTASMLSPYKRIGVDSIWRTPGIDSIYYSVNGRNHAIKDSTNGAGSNIYNSDGTFTGFRTITGNDKAFYILGVDEMITEANNWKVESRVFSSQIQVSDSISLRPYRGNLTVDSLNQSVVATNKMMVWDSVTKRVATQAIPTGGGVTSVSGTTNRITSTGGATPVIDISAAYVGQTSITTLGTIATGVWNGTAIANANLANSTISGIALGSNLNNLSISAELISGGATTYNGSAAKSIAIQAGSVTNAMLVNGAVANLSGTNTGDQTITLTSDVTGSGTGSFATTIAAGAVTLAKMANVATGTVFYRKTAATGVPEVQTLATLKTDLGLTGTNSGDQTITLTGDITGSGTGSFATTLATVNSNVGTFGGATQSLTATVNGKGLITAISAQTVTPAVGSITGLGTGVATALAVNIGSAGAFITFNGAAGTPSSLTGTNITGTATGLTAGAVNNSLSIAAELISGGATSYNGSAAKSIAIQPASVTNAMLAGSIASSKLVGTDITTIGTITSGGLGTGAVIGGVTITLGSDALYDVYYRGASGILTRLAAGTDGYQLTTHSTSSAPTWEAAGGGGSGLTFAQVSALMVIKY